MVESRPPTRDDGRHTTVDSSRVEIPGLLANDDFRWDEKAGLQRDALTSQVIDALETREIEETGDEEAYHHDRAANTQQTERTPDHYRLALQVVNVTATRNLC